MGKVLLIPNADFSQNSIGSAIIAPTISVSPSGRVTITSDFSVYYTTNGSTPNAASTLYSGAFVVSDGTTVKAVAYSSGVYSAVVSETYTADADKYQPFENATWFNGYWEEGAITEGANFASCQFIPLPSNGYYAIRPKTYAECGKYVAIRLYVADSATDNTATNFARDEDVYGYVNTTGSKSKGSLCTTGYLLPLSSSAQVFSICVMIRNVISGTAQSISPADVYNYISMEYIGLQDWSIGFWGASNRTPDWQYENYGTGDAAKKNFYGTHTPMALSDYTTISVVSGYAIRICLMTDSAYHYLRTDLLTGTINIADAIANIKTAETTRFGVNICIEGWTTPFSDAQALPFDVTETPNYVTIT